MSLEQSRKCDLLESKSTQSTPRICAEPGRHNDYGSVGAGSKSTLRGLDHPLELWWCSTGRSSEGSEKWILVAKAERKRTDVAMYQYGSDGLPQKIPIWELIQHRFGFHTHCRSFVGGLPFPQIQKNSEIFEAREWSHSIQFQSQKQSN